MTQQKNKYYIFKKISLIIFSAFFIGAGINHFWHPRGYLYLIPPYLPEKDLINILSGCMEIISGICMMFPVTRRLQLKGCVSKTLCVPEWVAWVRLVPFQFILMWWTWKTYKWNT